MDKMVRWRPFRDLMDVRDDFDKIMEGIMKPVENAWNHDKIPAIDVFEDKDNIFVKVEMAGLKKEDISISLSNSMLTISGKKAETKEEKKENYYRKEIREGSFSRSVELPCEVNRDKVSASYTDGLLDIILPKAAEAKSKEIKINVK